MASEVQTQNTNEMTLDALGQAVCARTEEEKKILLRQILRSIYGDDPQQEYAVWNEDGSSYMFLVPTDIHIDYQMTPEFIAELDRRAADPRPPIPLRETIAKLEAMEKEMNGQ